MVLVTRQGKTKEIQDLEKSFEELKTKFETHIEKDRTFKRKLEAEISKLRESHYEVADRLDILLKEWGEL